MNENQSPFDELVSIVARLRSPDGCLWDRAQTHESIKHNVVEEACEVADAIDSGDVSHLKEELGDLLLQVVFHSRMAEEADQFNIDDVSRGIVEKLRRRHPHVFAGEQAESEEQILRNWELIKSQEKERPSHLHGIPRSLPALMTAQNMQEKAARVGFDWPDVSGALAKVVEEARELARESQDKAAAEREFGDLLFALVNLARHMEIQAEFALRGACRRFHNRFAHIERLADERGKKLQEMSLEEMDELWEMSKVEGEQIDDN